MLTARRGSATLRRLRPPNNSCQAAPAPIARQPGTPVFRCASEKKVVSSILASVVPTAPQFVIPTDLAVAPTCAKVAFPVLATAGPNCAPIFDYYRGGLRRGFRALAVRASTAAVGVLRGTPGPLRRPVAFKDVPEWDIIIPATTAPISCESISSDLRGTGILDSNFKSATTGQTVGAPRIFCRKPSRTVGLLRPCL